MKLRNKKTGEIVSLQGELTYDDKVRLLTHYNSLAELNAEWEDATEEPKEFYWIDYDGEVKTFVTSYEWQEKMKELGNYFETKEEAEKAVERLRAWKRLKDKGFRFERWLLGGEYGNTITFSEYFETDDETRADLDLLFGGEE